MTKNHYSYTKNLLLPNGTDWVLVQGELRFVNNGECLSWILDGDTNIDSEVVIQKPVRISVANYLGRSLHKRDYRDNADLLVTYGNRSRILKLSQQAMGIVTSLSRLPTRVFS